MLPEIGHFALILALCLAIAQSVLPLIGATRNIPSWMLLARPMAYAQCGFLLLAFALLTLSFIKSDFSVLYVAQNSNSALPLPYRISAVWGAHEGSLLLWALMLGLWSAAVARFSRMLPMAFVARVISVMGMVSTGFLLFMLFTSNPFERLLPAAVEGRDLNPLLQDFGLILHPPMLYMGYVGFSVAFAFAVAALIGGHLDAAWARWSRPWTTVAWLFLTIGIALGSWWAYYELGWGGWWFWDPVENASFMPWLVGTALIHSLAVTEKRGAFTSWTVLLALFAFSLSLLGTFLVRSGVLTSVHAFATDPERGIFILAFLLVVIGGSLSLYAWRGPSMRSGGRFQGFSRETFLLINNVILVVAAASVLLGTLYPLLMDALGLGKISVGPPYFNTVFAPIMLPLVFLIGIGPIVRWKQDDPMSLFKQLRLTLVVALGAAVVFVLVATGTLSAGILLVIAIAFWVIFSAGQNLYKRIQSKNNVWTGIRNTPAAFWGMTVAHIGIGVFVIGVTLTSHYSVEKDVRMAPGEAFEIGPYTFKFVDSTSEPGPNYEARRVRIQVLQNDEHIAMLTPEKRIYRVQKNPMTEAAIDAGLLRDLYVALGEPLGQNAWSVRLYYKPYIRWIWLGSLIMAAGGVLAASDRRYRIGARRRKKLIATENIQTA
ncbi:MAG: heme lyase CcmF/NrfE family subunit [Gammaproteobacteria bacterium]|nr:MAG: heme lyase CcmF/NrfE family subunit [Gammaproteobacteria bacterium]